MIACSYSNSIQFKNRNFIWNFELIFQLFHDGWFTHAADTLLRKRMSNDAAPTYHYLFTHRGSATGSVAFGGDANTWYGKFILNLKTFVNS